MPTKQGDSIQGAGYQDDRFREAMYDGESGIIDRADHLRRICEEARREDPEGDLVVVPAEDVYWIVCAYEEALSRG